MELSEPHSENQNSRGQQVEPGASWHTGHRGGFACGRGSRLGAYQVRGGWTWRSPAATWWLRGQASGSRLRLPRPCPLLKPRPRRPVDLPGSLHRGTPTPRQPGAAPRVGVGAASARFLMGLLLLVFTSWNLTIPS